MAIGRQQGGAIVKELSWRQTVALFRMRVLGDLVHLEPGTSGLYSKLDQKAALVYQIPGSSRTRIAADTIRDWLRQYRSGGFEALLPKPRNDAGRPRALPDALIEILLAIKEEQRGLTMSQVIGQARTKNADFANIRISLATVHRLLSKNDLMQKPPEDPSSNDRRHFEFQKAGDLWMSDVMHGPAVSGDGKRKAKAYLIAFLDDATRVIPFAAFTLSENTEAFCGVFKQALMRRGIPRRLYVDNGSAYRSRQLELVCAKLGITLIHARAYQPQGKGKQERFFRTVRTQLLPLLTAQDLSSLEALNRRLWAYIEGEYHQSPHRGLAGHTPSDSWAMKADEVRYPSPAIDLDEIFLFEAKRKVQKDRTVSLDGLLYEIDASLVNETVLLRYDPAGRRGQSLKVWHKGRFVHEAKLVNAYANCYVKRNRPSQNPQPATTAPTPAEAATAPPAPLPGLRLADMPANDTDHKERR
jgi:putative transposase